MPVRGLWAVQQTELAKSASAQRPRTGIFRHIQSITCLSFNKRPKRPLSLTWEQWTHKKWLRNGTKNNNTSFHMLLDHCYTFGLLLYPSSLKKHLLEEGDPVAYFRPALDPPLGRSGRNTLMHVRCHEHFIPTKFHKHPSSSSVERAVFVFRYIYMH